MQLGMIGVGRMGGNMVRRLMKGGHACVVYNRTAAPVEALVKEGATAAATLEQLVAKLERPRAVWLMIPAAAVEPTLETLSGLLAPDDVVIDGGNSYYIDDLRRSKTLEAKRIHYLDVGTSGGVWGLERGYCLMIGGPEEAVRRLDPIFRTLAPGRGSIDRTPGRANPRASTRAEAAPGAAASRAASAAGGFTSMSPEADLGSNRAGDVDSAAGSAASAAAAADANAAGAGVRLSPTAEEGYLHCGPSGAGHFVKMVHNGIEYGVMAAYAEGLNILRHAGVGRQGRAVDAETSPLREPGHYQYAFNLADVAEVWRRGSVVASWLLDLTANALAKQPDLASFSGRVSDSGEGRWTLLAAIDEGAPAPVLGAALFQRFSSRGEEDFANKVLSALRYEFGGHEERK